MKLGYNNVMRMLIDEQKVVKIYVGETLTTYYFPYIAYFYSSRADDSELIATIKTNRNGILETIPDDLVSSTWYSEFKGWRDYLSDTYAKAGMQLSKDTNFYGEFGFAVYDKAGYIYVAPTSDIGSLQSEEFYSKYGRDPQKTYIEFYAAIKPDGAFQEEGIAGGSNTSYYLCNPSVLNEGYYDKNGNYYPPVFSGYTYSTDITLEFGGDTWRYAAEYSTGAQSAIAAVGIDTPTLGLGVGAEVYLMIINTIDYGELVVLRTSRPPIGEFGQWQWEDKELLDEDLILGAGNSSQFIPFSPDDYIDTQCAYQFIRYQDFVEGFVPLE